jgi:hypothetical protein
VKKARIHAEWLVSGRDFNSKLGEAGLLIIPTRFSVIRIFYDVTIYSTASKPALGPTQPPIPWVLGVLPAGVKRQSHEADHLPPSNAEVKNGGPITSFSLTCLRGLVLN